MNEEQNNMGGNSQYENTNQPPVNQSFTNNVQSSRESYYSDNNQNNIPSSNKKHIDKKYIIIALGILIVAVVVGIIISVTKSNNKKKENESIKESYVEDSIRSADDGTVGNDWKQFRFKIKDQREYIPLSYKRLNSMSKFTYKSHYEKTTISPLKRMKMNLYKDGKLALYVEAYNPNTTAISYKDATITKISQIKAHVDTYGASPVIFPGELTVGMKMTQEGLFNIFGETKNIKVTNNDGYISTFYKYAEDDEKSGSNYFEIELVGGVIYSLTLDHKG